MRFFAARAFLDLGSKGCRADEAYIADVFFA
jgi:hypothetical protein